MIMMQLRIQEDKYDLTVDEKQQRDAQIRWEGDPTPWGDIVVSLGKMIVHYRIGSER